MTFGDGEMENEQIIKIRKIRDAKETLKGLEKVTLIEVLIYIDYLIKIYEDRHKV